MATCGDERGVKPILKSLLHWCVRYAILFSSTDAGWSSLAARRAHNPKVVGSNPTPATIKHFKAGFLTKSGLFALGARYFAFGTMRETRRTSDRIRVGPAAADLSFTCNQPIASAPRGSSVIHPIARVLKAWSRPRYRTVRVRYPNAALRCRSMHVQCASERAFKSE